MAIRIFNNIPSLTAQRLLGVNNSRLAQSIERISSGLRINRGADDPAGLALSEKLRGDIRALTQALRNANDGVSMINVAEAGLGETADMLIRIKELAAQAATGTLGDTERATLQIEFDQLRAEINRISSATNFNGQKLLDGSMSAGATNPVVIQIGIDSSSDSRFDLNAEVDLDAINTSTLGISSIAVTTMAFTGLQEINITAVANALTALELIGTALDTVSTARGKIGAVQNRLVRTINNLSITIENVQAAESQIRDADIAQEIANLTRNQILVQASTAMVGQANLIPQTVLQLLQ
ncbi:flagellin N-terminal helical domain-containing protein [Nitrospina gracilis]|uniref:flagellin N-terminal helical domain-containing protein n=1 Tax=Nitrospina gracilis TaxID=35801 RepID=UPI001F3B7672|nr:flagellin [Nitrospina gracilis]MCF8721348.1 flagellin [Nitrospina gracilis Nb-211]